METKTSSGADLPAFSMSQIDVNAIPTHKATGKPLTQVNIDEGELSRALRVRFSEF